MAETAARSRPNNLPAELTSFVGRRKELREVKRLLTTTRLLTLTGSGGAGKTRLALRAAVEMARGFPDGVWLVSLAWVEDPQLVVQAVFNAVGLQDVSPAWSLSTLSHYLVGKHLLVVLDNCEHLLDACAPLVVTLLKACPELRILATSRQALGVTGETRMRIPPLSLPDDGAEVSPDRIAASEAVILLSERAAAVQPDFRVDATNASAVLRLCQRLDGIPLALELAAVRLEGLTVEQLVKGLEDDFPVLAKGSRGVEARQQTLEATLGWSYGLLEPQERLLWARLSVFAGGFDQAAATVVCSGSGLLPDSIGDTLASLVEKSIVVRDSDRRPPRFRMLEMVRTYGRTRLRESGEDEAVERRHRDWILQLARVVGAHDSRQAEAFDRIQLELDNVWSALDFCRRHPLEAATGIEISRLLYPYWWSRGPLGDVRRVVEALCPLTAEGSVARGWGLFLLACLAVMQNDAAAAPAMAEESLRIGLATNDPELAGWAGTAVIVSALENKTEKELVSVANEIGGGGKSAGIWFMEAVGLGLLSVVHLYAGALQEAVEAGQLSVAMYGQRGERWMHGQLLNNLSEAWRRLGNLEVARALAREGLEDKFALDDRRGVAVLVESLAWMACDCAEHAHAAVLLGHAHRVRETIGFELPSIHGARHDACEAAARHRLGDSSFEKGFKRGAEMEDREAIAFALAQSPPPAAAAPSKGGQAFTVLTRRELEVARLVGEGLASQQIARRLFLSDRTVTTHLTNIFNKLGINSRSQLAAWAAALREPVAAKDT